MGATAGIRNVINGYILKGIETQFKASTDNLSNLLGEKNFFTEFGFKYIAGRTEGMFGMIVGLNIVAPGDEDKQKKLLYVEMGGASTQIAFKQLKVRYGDKNFQFAKAGS
jgi:hypothetical protein